MDELCWASPDSASLFLLALLGLVLVASVKSAWSLPVLRHGKVSGAGQAEQDHSWHRLWLPPSWSTFRHRNAFLSQRRARQAFRDDRLRVALNWSTVVQVVLEVFQQGSFAFPPVDDGSGKPPAVQAAYWSFGSRLTNWSLLEFGAALPITSIPLPFLISTLFVVVWTTYSGLAIASVLLLSLHPSSFPRRILPFVSRNSVERLPLARLLLPMLASTLFLLTCRGLLLALTCSTRLCDSRLAALGLLGLYLYLPTSTFVGAFFLQGASDFTVSGLFLIVERVVKLFMLVAVVVGFDSPLSRVVVGLCANLSLLLFTLGLRPYRRHWRVNACRALAYCLTSWSCLVSLLLLSSAVSSGFVMLGSGAMFVVLLLIFVFSPSGRIVSRLFRVKS